MLTRREIEGQLRTLHPHQRQARSRRFASMKARRYVRIALGVLLGLSMVAALGAVRGGSAPRPAVAIRQFPVWGAETVRSYRPSETSLFPSVKRDRGNSYSARARVAREQVRGSNRRSR
jgi:hypothetical protein